MALAMVSCAREAMVDDPVEVEKVPMSLSARGEAPEDVPEAKVSLNYPNVLWSADDVIAVFDGTGMNEFCIDPSSYTTGATATFSGSVAANHGTLYAVYPYSSANSISGSSLSVTVPSNQTVSSTAMVDPAALVSVGQVSGNSIEFKQVCGLLKFTIETSGIEKVILRGTSLAGTATVSAATGVMSALTSGENSIVLSSADGTVATGSYYAAVLPGTTAAEVSPFPSWRQAVLPMKRQRPRLSPSSARRAGP